VGLRPDLVAATASVRFDFKVFANLLLLVSAAGLVLRLARPGARRGGWVMLLSAVPAALVLAAVLELFLLPSDQWAAAAIGHNATWCLRIIPALGAAPLLAALWGLREAAPDRPAVAGAIAGLMSAGLAGTLYALHCPDDSPLFVVLWYGIAAAVLTAAGAMLGARVMRW
jgi:hypothetical protein